MKKHYCYLLAIISITLLMLFFVYGKMGPDLSSKASWDLHKYRAISSAAPMLDASIPQPFAFRLLGPYLLGLLPGNTCQNYYIATLVIAMALVILFYCFLCNNGVRPEVAAVTVLLFSFNKYFFGFPVGDYFQINDLISLVMLTALYWCLLRRKWPAFSLFFILGVSARETALLIVPVSIVYLLESGTWRKEWKPFLLSITPGIALFLIIRKYIPCNGGSGLWQAFLLNYSKILSPGRLYALFINSFAPLVVVPIILCEKTISFFRKRIHGLVFLFLVLGSTLFGSNDERLMAPAFLMFYFLIAGLIQDCCLTAPKLMWLTLLLVFPTSFDYVIGMHRLPNITVMYAISIISMGIISCLFFLRRRVMMRLSQALT